MYFFQTCFLAIFYRSHHRLLFQPTWKNIFGVSAPSGLKTMGIPNWFWSGFCGSIPDHRKMSTRQNWNQVFFRGCSRRNFSFFFPAAKAFTAREIRHWTRAIRKGKVSLLHVFSLKQVFNHLECSKQHLGRAKTTKQIFSSRDQITFEQNFFSGTEKERRKSVGEFLLLNKRQWRKEERRRLLFKKSVSWGVVAVAPLQSGPLFFWQVCLSTKAKRWRKKGAKLAGDVGFFLSTLCLSQSGHTAFTC